MKDADTKAPMAQTTPIQWLTVDEGHEGQRLDNYLLAMLRGVPKTRIYRMIRKGEVRVDRRRVKAEQRVAAGERIRVPPRSCIIKRNDIIWDIYLFWLQLINFYSDRKSVVRERV